MLVSLQSLLVSKRCSAGHGRTRARTKKQNRKRLVLLSFSVTEGLIKKSSAILIRKNSIILFPNQYLKQRP